MTDTYKMQVEYTDTFGGEPNYCWVRRAEIEIPHGASKREVFRRARKAVGITGLRGTIYDGGDHIAFRPYRHCTIMMAHVIY